MFKIIKELDQIDVLIRAIYPIIYIVTSEEPRVFNILKEKFNNKRKIYVWSEVSDFRPIEDCNTIGNKTAHPIEALKYIFDSQEEAIYFRILKVKAKSEKKCALMN